MNTAINAGPNESGWIEWIVQNPSALQKEATTNAVANARMLAEQIAQKANVQLGNLVNLSENNNAASYSGPMEFDRIEMGAGVISGLQVGNQKLALNSRRVEFRVSVSASFAIE